MDAEICHRSVVRCYHRILMPKKEGISGKFYKDSPESHQLGFQFVYVTLLRHQMVALGEQTASLCLCLVLFLLPQLRELSLTRSRVTESCFR
ncbi:hypothetical protein AVEN_138578-1 [Araneus ventricosus]|uniref:Uncharacterized protein n=1 Tax=Araneus ventricosus TaxID=182803 RepID=A0A4Y2IW79_ARAVE|nr:hypothetical protein AVEN_138578-1 [Araneus ventricosus]